MSTALASKTQRIAACDLRDWLKDVEATGQLAEHLGRSLGFGTRRAH